MVEIKDKKIDAGEASIKRFLLEINKETVKVCVWKSSDRWDEGIAGTTDVDLLVAPDFFEIAVKNLKDNRWFQVTAEPWRRFDGVVDLVTSRKTKRLRNLVLDGKHLASLSHRRGLFILQEEGARLLHENSESLQYRVVIDPETASFNRDGKSVFCKFVKDVDGGLKCMDECVVVTPKDELVAFGKLIVGPEEIKLGQQGMAIRVRGGIPE